MTTSICIICRKHIAREGALLCTPHADAWLASPEMQRVRDWSCVGVFDDYLASMMADFVTRARAEGL